MFLHHSATYYFKISQAYYPFSPWSMPIFISLNMLAVGLNLIQLCCYAIFFCHVFYHDNRVAIQVVKREVIRQRNRSNAISMAGLFATWVIELAFYSWILFFRARSNYGQLREMSTIIKMAEFVLIPTVQIFTSPPLRRYFQANNF